MELDLAAQFALLLSCFFAGVAGGVLHEVLTACRILLGAYAPPEFMRARYARPLPLLRRAPRFSQTGGRRAWCAAVTFLLDVLLCVILACSAILACYRYNDGAVRLLALLSLFLGLFACRVLLSRVASGLCALFAYGLAVLFLYLKALILLPVRGLFALFRICILRPVRACLVRLRRRLRSRESEALCRRQLMLASVGLDVALLQKEGNKQGEKKKQAVRDGDPHPHDDHRGLLCLDPLNGGAFDGAQPHESRDRRIKEKDRAIRAARRRRIMRQDRV